MKHKQEYPKKIYVKMNTIPPCNYGALWFEDRDEPEDVGYILASEVEKALQQAYKWLSLFAGMCP